MYDRRLFPTVMIFFDILAAIGYLPTDNWRMVIYWIAAGCLTFCVTW